MNTSTLSRLKLRKILPEDSQAIKKLLDDVEWPPFPYITDPELFEKFLANQSRIVVALEDGRLVGVAGASCNETSIGYITLFAVAPDKQGHGIGDKLAKTIMGNDPHVKWVLSSLSQSVGFWEKQGFVFATMMVKNREIDTFSQGHSDTTSNPKFNKFFRKQLSRIYRLNLYQCHQFIKQLIAKVIR